MGLARYPKSSIIAKLDDGLVVAEEETVFNPLRNADTYAAPPQQTAYGYSLNLYYWKDGGTSGNAGFRQ